MGRTAIGVWLTIALIGVLLYMLPALLKQLFFVKEQFMGGLEAATEWEGEQLAADAPFEEEGYVDVPKEAAKAKPEYLQHIPGSFVVGGVGGTSLESQPAPIDQVVEEVTPMQQQGMMMKKAPASGPVEGFQAGTPSAAGAGQPSAAVKPSAGTPSAAGAGQPSAAGAGQPSAAGTPSTCKLQHTYNPQGPPLWTCDGKIVDNRGQTPSVIPKCLSSISTKDGIDEKEADIMNYCMSVKPGDMDPWVVTMLDKEELTPSEKNALAAFAKEKVKPSQQIVKPTKTSETTGTSSTTSTKSSTSKKCKPACKPKPKCSTDTSASGTSDKDTETKAPATKCKGPIDMGDYIRKDSIPCWACKL